MKGPENRVGIKPRTRAVLMAPVTLLTYLTASSNPAFSDGTTHTSEPSSLARRGITHTPDLGKIPESEESIEGAKCTGVINLNAGPRRSVELILFTGDTGPRVDSATPQPAVAGPYFTAAIYRDAATPFNANNPEKRATAIIVTDPDGKKAQGIRMDGTPVDLTSAYRKDYVEGNKGSSMGNNMVGVLLGDDRIRPSGYNGKVNCEPAPIPAWLTDVNNVDPKAIAVFINPKVSASAATN